MKIIFLDVDGVLNIMSDSYRTYMRHDNHIEAHLVKRLEYLIEKTNANIVISSSWRSNMGDLKLQMEINGFKHWDKVIGRTGRDNEGMRGNEIKEWLDNTEYNIEAYCVLEDEPADICGSKCRAIMSYYVVKTDSNEGLSDNDIKRALYILEKGLL